MQVTVRKPAEAEKQFMQKQPTWSCGVSEFDWYYDSEETCLLIEGEVTVDYGGGSVCFGAGDYVVFPQGLECVWKVTKPVRKHYIFR
jgi:uncharacterized cupin superfamily protein